MSRLSGKVALVTGCSGERGIGRAIARRLAEDGADVVLTSSGVRLAINKPTTGWGGRVCDMVACANPANIPIMTSLSGQDFFLRGQNVNGYIMTPTGA